MWPLEVKVVICLLFLNQGERNSIILPESYNHQNSFSNDQCSFQVKSVVNSPTVHEDGPLGRLDELQD